MKKVYHQIETIFEKMTAVATTILGSSVTFICVLGLVIFWWSQKEFYTQGIYQSIKDVIHGITFLTLFIIQKEFNRFSIALHLKVNELVVSHKPANNAVVNIEQKTEHEMIELAREYAELAEKTAQK